MLTVNNLQNKIGENRLHKSFGRVSRFKSFARAYRSRSRTHPHKSFTYEYANRSPAPSPKSFAWVLAQSIRSPIPKIFAPTSQAIPVCIIGLSTFHPINTMLKKTIQ